MGKYGGAAFLIPYFLFVALFGLVGLSGEFALGRLTGTGPVGSYDYAMRSRGKRGGRLLGAFPLLGSLGIAIGYAVIVGWVLRSMAARPPESSSPPRRTPIFRRRPDGSAACRGIWRSCC